MKRIKADLLWLLFIAFIVNFAVIYGRKIPVGGNGGDTIIHMAMIRGIYLGRNPFLDQHYNIYPNWYPFLYHSLIAILSKLTHISIWELMIWTPLLFALTMVFSWFKLGEEVGDEHGGLVMGAISFLIMKSQLFPNPKALIPIFLPLFYLEYHRYFKSRENRYLLYAGVVLGLMLWSHYGAAMPVLVGVIVYALVTLRETPRLLIPPLVALALFSPFIFNIFLHVQPGSGMMVEGKWLSALSWSSTLHRVLPSLWALVFIGATLLLLRRERLEFWNFVLVITISMIALNVAPAVIYHLGGPAVFPSRFGIPLTYTYLLLCWFGIYFLLNSSKIRIKQSLSLILSLLLIGYGSWSFVEYNYHNFSSKYTYTDFKNIGGNYSKGLLLVSEWINRNSHRDDYLIGHPYTLEWIAGFTGRPVVAVTYGHGNPFLDMRQRREDIRQFFMNPSSRRRIIEKYHIKYIVLGPFTESVYNVSVNDFNSSFVERYSWWKFHILEVEDKNSNKKAGNGG